MHIIDVIRSCLPSTKVNSTGWIVFNAVCCHHRHTSKDKRKRGGIRFENDGFFYHCFNCNFSIGWKQGEYVQKEHKLFFQWLGIDDSEINKIILYALKNSGKIKDNEFNIGIPEFKDICLPDNSELIDNNIKFKCVLDYFSKRGIDYKEYSYYWSINTPNRFIIPYYYNSKLVGYNSRYIGVDNKKISKYIKHTQNGYVFNIDKQNYYRKYVIITEGELDAIAIDGVAVLSNSISKLQSNLIKTLDKQVIVCPDNDSSGSLLIKDAIENNWGVYFPLWDDNIKDVREAVNQYGKLQVLNDIIANAEFNKIKVEIRLIQRRTKYEKHTIKNNRY